MRKILFFISLFCAQAAWAQSSKYPPTGSSTMGTVTSITAGTGLTGGTITSSGTIALAIPVTVPDGGTGDTSLTLNGILFGNGTSAVGVTAAGTTGQVLTATTSGAPTWQSPATSGTVTSVSVATANGFSGTVANPTTTPAITLTLGSNAVANSQLAQMPTLTIKGNNTGGTANAADLTVAQVDAILPVFTSLLNGLAPLSGGGTTNYLRADGTWAAPPGATSGTVTSVGMTVPSFLSVTPSTITSSGTFAVSLATETANTVFAGPASGSAAAPTFRALVSADLPAGAGLATQNISSTTALSTASGDLVIFLDSTSAAFNVTLPSPSANTLRRIYFKDSTGQLGTNNVTVLRNASESIEGIAASYILQSTWSSTCFISNGTNWFIL